MLSQLHVMVSAILILSSFSIASVNSEPSTYSEAVPPWIWQNPTPYFIPRGRNTTTIFITPHTTRTMTETTVVFEASTSMPTFSFPEIVPVTETIVMTSTSVRKNTPIATTVQISTSIVKSAPTSTTIEISKSIVKSAPNSNTPILSETSSTVGLKASSTFVSAKSSTYAVPTSSFTAPFANNGGMSMYLEWSLALWAMILGLGVLYGYG